MRFFGMAAEFLALMRLGKKAGQCETEEAFDRAQERLGEFARKARDRAAEDEVRFGAGAGSFRLGLALLAEGMGALQKALAHPRGDSERLALEGLETARAARERKAEGFAEALLGGARQAGLMAAAAGFADAGDFARAQEALDRLGEGRKPSRPGEMPEILKARLAWRRGDLAEHARGMLDRLGSEGMARALGGKQEKALRRMRRHSGEARAFAAALEEACALAREEATARARERLGGDPGGELKAAREREGLSAAAAPGKGKGARRGM